MLLANQHFQYSLIVNISLMDWHLILFFFFLHADRHDWTQHGLSEKNIFWSKRAILTLKMARPHNFGSILRIFLKFCTVKRVQEVHKNYINGFSEKILIWGKWAILGSKMARRLNPGSILRIFLKFCTMKGAERYMEHILIVFLKNSYLEQICHFRLKMTRRHNSGSFLRIF